ncbi:hypothetical protein TNCV_1644981 [Trichonephila clavipes]|nr:hypothetical protein TNCV_1644981 [Trichonephila clavipes]
MAYLRCPVREYIPNPLRCFNCQRYGHSKNVCRGQPTCPRCGEVGHDSNDCGKKERCRLGVLSHHAHQSPGVSYANVAKTTQANFTQTCAEHFKELEDKNAPPPTKNSPPSTKKSSPSTTSSPPPAKKKIISRPPSASPKRPKSRKARQREMSLSQHPENV